jgi:hypothetical protein
VVLNRERAQVERSHALDRHVVEVHVRELDRPERRRGDHGRHSRGDPGGDVARVVRPAAAALRVERADGAEVHAEAVVLARDLDLTGEQVHHGLVAAPMPVLELEGRRSEREREHLVPEADAEHRLDPEQVPQGRVQVVHGRRVARPVGEEHTVRVHR